MDAKKVNEILKRIFEKESTTDEEKKALMTACDCVWKVKESKVIDEKSFNQMLFDNMAFDYEVEVNKTDKDTKFIISTFKKTEKMPNH